MISFPTLLAPLALLFPAAAIVGASDARLAPHEAAENEAPVEPGWLPLTAASETPVYDQVRIEQRVTIRITPRGSAPRQNMLAELPVAPIPRDMTERKMGKCVPVAGIAAVQTGQGSRLILYMRDQRIVSASLEKACRARDFYSGFYLERSADGMLCVDRDKLQSRTGVQCEVSRLRQLVADDSGD